MGLRKISSIRLCVRMCGMHGAEEDLKYMAVCERCVACMGLKEDLKYKAVCEDVWHAWG